MKVPTFKKIWILIFIISSYSCQHSRYSHQYANFFSHISVQKIEQLPSRLITDTFFIRTMLPTNRIATGIESTEEYLPLLAGKRVAVVTNQTGLIGDIHLVDFLIESGVKPVKVFSPEHGFRGNIERGISVSDTVDIKTGISIVGLYGKYKKPSSEQLADIDVILFDIQDVGVRFFTYISTMHYVMEACAENSIPLIILDRPNPLGDYVDGPVLEPSYRSFIGMHPIPIVHGLTMGELACMINGEGWLKNGIKCDLKVIKAQYYSHSDRWHISVKPSPNLPNDIAIRLYPSLCLFEATEVSIGRGTNLPFQVLGYPNPKFGDFQFIPEDIPGIQTNPIQEGRICYGLNLQNALSGERFTLKYLIEFGDLFTNRQDMITRPEWFKLLSGTDALFDDFISGKSEKEIRERWCKDLEEYKKLRKKYLLYPDFE